MRDGSTLRVLLLPSYHNITLQLSGLKCPGFKREGDSEVAEPFAEEAKQFVETRLLQRDIKVILEGVANQSNGILLGTVLHPVCFFCCCCCCSSCPVFLRIFLFLYLLFIKIEW